MKLLALIFRTLTVLAILCVYHHPAIAAPPQKPAQNFKKVAIPIAGIDPRVSAKQLDGDLIKVGPKGFNNISIRIGRASEGREIWRVDRGAIATVRFDPASKFYILQLSPEASENPWLTFTEPLRLRVIAHTEFDNAYWFEAIRQPEALGDPVVLDHYSGTEGQNDLPMNAAERTAHWAKIRGTPASTDSTTSPAAPSTVAEPKEPKEVVMTEYELRLEREAMARAAIASGSAKIAITGFDSGLLSRLLPGDELSTAKNNLVISTKNEGTDLWAWIKKKTVEIGRDTEGRPTIFVDYEIRTSDRMYFDKPVLIRVELATTQGKRIWTEVVRQVGEFGKPILLDRYTGTDQSPVDPPKKGFFSR